jgi:single-stranded-DNA-specific exonuclease
MPPSPQWRLPDLPPVDFIQAVTPLVKSLLPEGEARYVAQLLWQRGMRDVEKLPGFLSPTAYQPASPFAFGLEMEWAVARILQAQEKQEKVVIWGDFDADGVTATAVLWEGLGQFLPQQRQLSYYIPDRLITSHGLSQQSIAMLHGKGCQLIITCDTGSGNLDEIRYANSLGIDVIITDHHTLPLERPPVVAIINPRTLPRDHALAQLSGVAVAYKLVEALYLTQPTLPQQPVDKLPQQPLEQLLDLVAIGLIADLVELTGDCRYLAQRGIEQLQTHMQRSPSQQIRPGITRLLELCKRTGDRPTDISFGIGPRINAVSRIQGDAHFCVELLTSRDAHLCNHLAEATELANARRKALQKDVLQQVQAKVAQLDLSTTRVIVLWDDQWHPGVLGLVAGQIAQEYGRPTILLSTEGRGIAAGNAEEQREATRNEPLTVPPQPGDWQARIQALKADSPNLAKGSARSVQGIDLYQLMQAQAHLLHRFGGHPFAAGLSLPVENIPLFTAAINQRLGQQGEARELTLQADLSVTVNELGQDLFQALKLLEPCGMGNPAPKLVIQNCWFEQVENRKIKDLRGQKLEYIKTQFVIWDDSVKTGFPGVWWGHYGDELPADRCDVIAELESNPLKRHYEIRLIAVRPASPVNAAPVQADWLDWRTATPQPVISKPVPSTSDRLPIPEPTIAPLSISTCPTNWVELRTWLRRATEANRPLAIAYPPPVQLPPVEVWQNLVGLAKFLSRTGQPVSSQQLCDRLGISAQTLKLGLRALKPLGFTATPDAAASYQIMGSAPADEPNDYIFAFLAAVQEDQFRKQYFYQMPLTTLQAIAQQTP